MSGKEISKNISNKDYNRADNIIRYLLNPDDETVQLTATEKKMFSLYQEIHNYRLRFLNKSDVAAVIVRTKNVGERQAYNLINEAEKIFGGVQLLNKEYERQFLLNKSLKNIEIAMSSRNSNWITKALTAHYMFADLKDKNPDMPDFSKLEQHIYKIVLPEEMIDMMQKIAKNGAINLEEYVPPPKFDTSNITEAKEEL